MLGLAQKLFIERASLPSSPWKGVKQNTPHWPLLETMLQAKRLGYVDLALAQRLLHPCPQATEAVAALLCHLSLASRQGHLCVTINKENIYPAVESVWLPPVDYSGGASQEIPDMLQELTRLIISAAETIPSTLLHEISPVADREALFNHSIPSSPICKNDQRYYLQRYWVLESQFLEHLLPLMSQTIPPALKLAEEIVKSKVEELLNQKHLLPEQGVAVMHGCLHALTLITGGPGTGKTHTAGILLRTLWDSFTHEQRRLCRIGLAAPTGKAAANLEGSICRALQDVEGFPVITAKTLHTLLGIGKNQRQGAAMVLPYDVLLVDESSMIDVRVMGQLLAAIKPGCRLIMLGDRYQLPPVEAGSLFSDLVMLLENSQRSHIVNELKTCLRAELCSIVDLAVNINSGNESEVQVLFENADKDSGIAFVPFEKTESAKEQQRRLLAYGSNKFPCIKSLEHPLDALKDFARFRILTPLRKGPLGVEVLNALFLQMAVKQARMRQAAFFVAPIMIVQNDHRQELFNGEVGLLVRPISALALNSGLSISLSGSYALFAESGLKNGPGIRNIPIVRLPKYEYAYCLSVHKSQGSEFEHVVMVLPEGSEHFGREVLYTGITRARKALEIWSTPEILNQTMAQVSRRHSGVLDRSDLK